MADSRITTWPYRTEGRDGAPWPRNEVRDRSCVPGVVQRTIRSSSSKREFTLRTSGIANLYGANARARGGKRFTVPVWGAGVKRSIAYSRISFMWRNVDFGTQRYKGILPLLPLNIVLWAQARRPEVTVFWCWGEGKWWPGINYS